MAILKRVSKRTGKASWQVMIDRRDPVTGARKRVTVGTFKAKKEAAKAERNAMAQRDNGTLLNPDTTTVAELLDRYLDIEVPRTVRLENRAPYEIAIRKHLKPAIGGVQVRRLTVEHVERLMADMQSAGYSSSLITKVRMRLSSALRLGVRWGLVSTNVAEAARPPKVAYRKATIWTPAEAGAFVDAAADDARWPLWLVMVESGARTSELLGLTWEDADLERGTLRLGRQVVRLGPTGSPTLKDDGKTRAASRTIRVSAGTVEELRQYRRQWLERKIANGPDWNPAGLLFTTRTGAPLSANNLRRAFDRIVTDAKVPAITPHAVRKTAITHALANGASPKAVAARVGHADARLTLDVYSAITSEMDDALLDIVTAIMPRRRQDAG